MGDVVHDASTMSSNGSVPRTRYWTYPAGNGLSPGPLDRSGGTGTEAAQYRLSSTHINRNLMRIPCRC